MADPRYNDGDFIEMLLRHLILCPKTLAKALMQKMTKEDFTLDKEFSNHIYEAFADIAVTVKSPPISSLVFLSELKTKFDSFALFGQHQDPSLALMEYVYNSDQPLNPEFFITHMKPFLDYRRSERAIKEKSSYDDLRRKLNSIAIQLDAGDMVHDASQSLNPFENLVVKDQQSLTGTGLCRIDSQMGGLGYGEFGLIIGYSGGGKTALGTNICSNNALAGKNATFLSMEELAANVAYRFYSKFFRISYTQLHRGEAIMQLRDSFNNPVNLAHKQLLARHLHLEGLKEAAPLTVDHLYNNLTHHYEETGFIPEVVVLDQLQFLIPRDTNAKLQSWEKEKIVAAECDELSHQKIGGRPFALWVIHQAKGKNKKSFSSEEIDGFKGIIHKPDTVVGIGRDGPMSTEYEVFSLKCRHSKNFMVKLFGNLEFMEFLDEDPAGLDRQLTMGLSQPGENTTPSGSARPVRRGPPPAPQMHGSNPMTAT